MFIPSQIIFTGIVVFNSHSQSMYYVSVTLQVMEIHLVLAWPLNRRQAMEVKVMVRHTLPSQEEGTRGRRSAPGSLTTPTGDRGGRISHQEEQQFICCIVYSLDIHTQTKW